MAEGAQAGADTLSWWFTFDGSRGGGRGGGGSWGGGGWNNCGGGGKGGEAIVGVIALVVATYVGLAIATSAIVFSVGTVGGFVVGGFADLCHLMGVPIRGMEVPPDSPKSAKSATEPVRVRYW
jgi:hypothetical protein